MGVKFGDHVFYQRAKRWSIMISERTWRHPTDHLHANCWVAVAVVVLTVGKESNAVGYTKNMFKASSYIP